MKAHVSQTAQVSKTKKAENLFGGDHPVSGSGKQNIKKRKKTGFKQQCLLCKRRFLKRSDLFQHKESAHSQSPQDCFHSPDKNEVKSSRNIAKGTESATNLNAHMKSVQDGKKSFKCDICDSCYISDYELKAHISSVHERNMLLQCEECAVSFSSQKSLYEHNLLLHEKKKPYKCNVCGYNFASTSYLQRHIAAIHEGKKSNNDATNLKKRKELENVEIEEASRMKKNSCSYCGKTFPKNQNLITHVITIHEKKKPFKCDTCGDCFGTNQRLGSHINSVHAKIKKQYPCSICDKKYCRKDRLSTHLKTIHKM